VSQEGGRSGYPSDRGHVEAEHSPHRAARAHLCADAETASAEVSNSPNSEEVPYESIVNVYGRLPGSVLHVARGFAGYSYR
jgi:hypothetical protein